MAQAKAVLRHPQRDLALDLGRGVAGVVLLHNEPLDLSVLRVTGEDDDHVAPHGVAGPALTAVDHPLIAVPPGRGLEDDRNVTRPNRLVEVPQLLLAWQGGAHGAADCRFLTITGPGRARGFVESSAAELTSAPDMEVALALAARHDVETVPGG